MGFRDNKVVRCFSFSAKLFWYTSFVFTILNVYYTFRFLKPGIDEGITVAEDCALSKTRNFTLCERDAQQVGEWLGRKSDDEIKILHEYWKQQLAQKRELVEEEIGLIAKNETLLSLNSKKSDDDKQCDCKC